MVFSLVLATVLSQKIYFDDSWREDNETVGHFSQIGKKICFKYLTVAYSVIVDIKIKHVSALSRTFVNVDYLGSSHGNYYNHLMISLGYYQMNKPNCVFLSIQRKWQLSEQYKEILKRMTRKPESRQFFGLMGKRGSGRLTTS